MGYKHSREDLLAAATGLAAESGIGALTFGSVGLRLGISDRTVVYYFPTKDDLVAEVLMSMGLQLQATLAPAFTAPAADHLGLVRTAWPVLARPEADGVFGLFFEANGLAATGREPYRTVVPSLVEAWIDWAATFVEGPAKQRRVEAETAIAMIDGLLLLRQLAGSAAADRAACRLGVR